MDDFDDERFSRPILSSAPVARRVRRPSELPEGGGRRRIRGSREEQLLGAPGAQQAVRVRGLDARERDRIRDEVQLLASLEIARITAAPGVLELEDDGYVREAAPGRRARSGRRAADDVAPPTGERRALATARDSLDELLDALHAQGWVLGAAAGDGLGLRADGTVLVLDLDGLRRDESLSARHLDRLWVDSVLQDQDRTLRRRVHHGTQRSTDDALGTTQDSPQRALLIAEGAVSRGAAPGPSEPDQPALPAPRRVRRRAASSPARTGEEGEEEPGEASLAVSGRGSTGNGFPGLSTLREVLHQPRLRRISMLSGALVLLACLLIGGGAWWARDRDGAQVSTGTVPSGRTERPGAPAEDASRPAPAIEDPQMLVAELAGARHAYVTGISSQPASAPRTPALLEDQRLREAYEGTTVSGGGPVVHSAEILVAADRAGTAVLRAVTSMEELQVEDSAGRVSTIPASSAVTILLELRWDGTQWRIVAVDPLEPADPV